MPDEQQAQEPILEMGEPDKGGGAARTLLILTIIATILFVGFLVIWHYRLLSVASNENAAFSALQEQLNNPANKKIEDKANSVSSSVLVLSNASKSKYLFRAFIDQLDTKITNDTKLNSLSIDNSGKVSLDGESASYRSVADLAVALQTSDKLKDVTISGLSQSSANESGNKQNLVTFSISAMIKDWKIQTPETQELPSATGEVPTVGGL